MNMKKVEIYQVTPNGTRGSLIHTIKYQTEEEAQMASIVLKSLHKFKKGEKIRIPCDSTKTESGEKLVKLPDYIITKALPVV